MTATITLPYSDQLMAVHALASMLERLETSLVRPDPAQYRTLVQRLTTALEAAQADDVPGLATMLRAHPSAAALYENLNYGRAGLCCAPMEASVLSELAAQEVLQRLGRNAA